MDAEDVSWRIESMVGKFYEGKLARDLDDIESSFESNFYDLLIMLTLNLKILGSDF